MPRCSAFLSTYFYHSLSLIYYISFFTSFKSRVMIVDKRVRSLLRTYIARYDKLTVQELLEMRERLRENCQQLHVFISWCEDEYQGRCNFPPAIVSFLKCIISISPVVSYFPVCKDFRAILHEIKAGLQIRRYPGKLAQLQSIAPIICDLIVSLPTGEMPISVQDLLDALEEKIKFVAHAEPHHLPLLGNDAEDDQSMCYLPNWPALCIRGRYKKDVERKECQHNCRKESRGHPSLLPGIFTLYCPHGIHIFIFTNLYPVLLYPRYSLVLVSFECHFMLCGEYA